MRFWRQRSSSPESITWGSQRNQLVDVYLAPDAPYMGVVALIHGGFWRAEHGRALMEAGARDLAARHCTVGNVGYRRVGEPGGGWPGTCDDVVSGLRALVAAHGPLAAVVGHSAGGHLALWASKEIEPRPRVVVSVAGVNDLARAEHMHLGAGAATAFSGPSLASLVAADPVRRVPLGTKTVLICATEDMVVPRVLSESYLRAASAAGDDVKILDVHGDHYSALDPSTAVWSAVVDAIDMPA